VLDWWSGQTKSDVWIDVLLDKIARWKPFTVFGEAGVIQKAVEPSIIKRLRERKILFPANSTWGDRVMDQCVGFPNGKDDAFDVMSHMCLAIAEAHPAILPPEMKPPKRHDYDRKPEVDPEAWKHA
jgi:hypothetical protein